MRAYTSKSQFIVDDFIDQHTIVSNMAIPILFAFAKQAVVDILTAGYWTKHFILLIIKQFMHVF